MNKGDAAVWRNFDTLSPFNNDNDKAYLPQTYAADPAVLRLALTHASDLLSAKLVSHLVP